MQKARLLILSLIAAAATFPLYSQVMEKQTQPGRSVESRALENILGKQDTGLDKIRALPMEGPVNVNTYVVGPSDLLNIAVWGPVALTYSIPVTPEGTLIIPTVGDVPVDGLTLVDVKRKVKELVRKKYSLGDVSVTLLSPRSFVVTLRGAVLRQGQFIASAVDRVEKILLQGASSVSPTPTVNIPAFTAEGEGPLARMDQLQVPQVDQRTDVYERASTRNIILIRRNGDSVRVDIPRFYATSNDRNNPFLLDGDIIFVPQRNLSRNSVAVFGAVNAPGRYEFVEGDSLVAVIQIAQGVTKSADLEHVLISRVNDRGDRADELEFNAKRILEGQQPDVPLQRGDGIVIPLIPSYRNVYSVTVAGEVNKPGVYPILRKGTKLSKIIHDVGGFTQDALLSGAVILRRDDESKDLLGSQLYYLRNVRSQQLTIADSAYFYLDLKFSRHPVVVDFVKLAQDRDSTQDVTLWEDDLIYVPSNHQTVLVHGQVRNPGYIPFIPAMDYRYYVQKAGGFSELAVTGDTRVIKKATLEWLDPSDTVIQPGDQIWVPKKPIREFSTTFIMVRDILAVTASLATTVILAFQVFK